MTIALIPILVSVGLSQGVSLNSAASIGQNCSLQIDAGASRAGQGYILDISVQGAFPGVPLGDGTGRMIPLNQPWIYLQAEGQSFPQVFQNFEGLIGGTGFATASLALPSAPVLLGLQFDAMFVTYDLGATTVDYISPSTGFVVTDNSNSAYTAWQPGPNTRRVYVSSSTGSDSNDGLSPSQAKQSISAGYELLRSGYPDWLLLKRGDEWYEGLGRWEKEGLSASQPIFVSSYGLARERPLLKTGDISGMSVFGGAQTSPRVDNVAVSGIHFYAHTRDPESPEFTGIAGGSGLFWWNPGTNITIEDCVFQYYDVGINMHTPNGQDGPENVTIRRCLIIDSYAASGHSQGIYMSHCSDVVIEDCVLDRNGWSPFVSGAEPTIFNHNIYIQHTNTNVVVRRNVIARASAHGLQLRPGGVCEDNLFVANPLNISIGSWSSYLPAPPSRPPVQVFRNVVTEGGDIGANLMRGYGIDLYGIDYGAEIRDNIIAHEASAGSSTRGFHFWTNNGGPGNHNITFENNTVWNWPNSTVSHNPPDIVVDYNLVDDAGLAASANNIMSSTVNFLDPNRTVGSYAATQGLPATTEAFLEAARNQSRFSWDPAFTPAMVNEYFRAGFQPQTSLGSPQVGAVSYGN